MKLEKYITNFKTHIGTAVEAIGNAAKCYAAACHEYPETAQSKFEEEYPHVTPNTWAKFRAVGEGDLNPSAMLLSDQFCAKVARMPRAKQDEILNGDSFMVFNPTTRKVEKVNYGMLKPRHEKILFDEQATKVRTIPEQVAYTDLLAAEKKAARRCYTVHTDRLEVHCACDIGKNELEGILEDMQ